MQNQSNPVQPEYNLFLDTHWGERKDLINCMQTLSKMVQTETWDFKTAKKPQFSILTNYIIFTYDRLKEENKIQFAEKDDRKYMSFNTGLLTDYYQDVYAVFEYGKTKTSESYLFKDFMLDSDRWMKLFQFLPKPANYFTNPSDFIFDASKEIYVDYNHIIDDNYDRFVSINLTDKFTIMSLLSSAVTRLTKLLQRNYKLAIPQYFTNKYTNESSIQLLLPLFLTSGDKSDLVLVAERMSDYYIGRTILTTEMAYINARRISKPNTDWLKIE